MTNIITWFRRFRFSLSLKSSLDRYIFDLLCEVPNTTFWGQAINMFTKNPSTEKFKELMNSLHSQYKDCPEIMTSIVGTNLACFLHTYEPV